MKSELTVNSWIALVRDRAESVARSHDAGQLHLRAQDEESLRDSWEVDGCAWIRLKANHWVQAVDLVPRELREQLPLDLPLDLTAARSKLRGTRPSLDAVQIDLHQLGALVCRYTTGKGLGDYIRSPRAKANLPLDVRILIERACGIDGQTRFENVREFLGSLSRIESESQISEKRDSAGSQREWKSALPSRLGQYELLSQIGSGGMGEVHLARDSSLGRQVAIKLLPQELARQDDFVRRFYSEAAAAARVIHPNVIPIHFIGEDLGYHYFVMPFIEGETLAQRLRRQGHLSPTETVRIASDVLNGLQAAHDHNLIHRDIKPGNVLLERCTGRAIVADFGLVKSATDGVGRTATGVILGTADYMSPEQGRGHPIDHRSDLYAMGIMLYQMLSGRLPFAADSLTAMIFQHVYERPIPLPELSREIPEQFWCIVRCLLAKSPALRYASARQVRDDLIAAGKNRPLPSRSDQINPEELWLPTPTTNFGEERPRIVNAPVLDDNSHCDIDYATPKRANDLINWIRSLFFRGPSDVLALEGTSQQADGVIAEYERRHSSCSRSSRRETQS